MKVISLILIVGVTLLCFGCSAERINSPEPDFSRIDEFDEPILGNRPPVIECIDCSRTSVRPGARVQINVRAYDPDGDELTYEYKATGNIMIKSSVAYWTVPGSTGAYTIVVKVSDGEYTVMKKIILKVTDTILEQPLDH